MTHKELCALAKSAAEKCQICAEGWPAPQATAMLCKSGAHYVFENDKYDSILAQMKHNGGTAVEAVVTYWKGENCSDIHCFALRKALFEMNKENENTLVLLGNKAKRLGDLMPPKK